MHPAKQAQIPDKNLQQTLPVRNWYTVDDFYRIYNLKYSNARIAKWGKGDGEWGTYDGDLYDDQVWKLVPRFKAAISNINIWSCDNREGSVDFSEEKSVTIGLKLTSSSTVSTTVGLEVSLKASASFAGFGAEVESKISKQIQKSLSNTAEKDWIRKSTIKFTAPKGKNYRVKQLTCSFMSPLAADDCVLNCDYVVEETDGDFPN
ncbi:tetratricopeptide repeat 28-like [Paramuricea clavata]|uniref:Tetratricopeptide repeat 28-like n=1 Tax=Paramuricea clavata TaxID=317549 RepID=A0A7D9EAL1_PARCT|nr:tetratricopeptide repeat 28-like [Paramuricea clavata]